MCKMFKCNNKVNGVCTYALTKKQLNSTNQASIIIFKLMQEFPEFI